MVTLEADDFGPVTLTGPADFDAHIHDLTATLDQPILITLSSETERLRVGVGHPGEASLVLFLDQVREPWHAVGPNAPRSDGGELEFREGSTVYRFGSELRVSEALARSAARQFVETGTRPTVVRWRREPQE